MTNTETSEATDRVARFKSDVAEMRLSDPRASRDRIWGIIGGVLMALGIGLAVAAYFQSSGASAAFNTEGPATQRDAIVIALIGVSVTVVGAALFLRFTFAQFLRFWLARLIYEQQAQTDRVVEATTQR
ncbi:MAG TPA: hypothetical protein VFX21_08910 [Acidimicrobiia bacterium]|nr:hypothetical protein [Acidimicrobiia bacterium]